MGGYCDFTGEDVVGGEGEGLVEAAIVEDLVVDEVVVQFVLDVDLAELLEVDQAQRVEDRHLVAAHLVVPDEHVGRQRQRLLAFDVLGGADLGVRELFLLGEDGVPVVVHLFGVGLPGLVHGLRVSRAESGSE